MAWEESVSRVSLLGSNTESLSVSSLGLSWSSKGCEVQRTKVRPHRSPVKYILDLSNNCRACTALIKAYMMRTPQDKGNERCQRSRAAQHLRKTYFPSIKEMPLRLAGKREIKLFSSRTMSRFPNLQIRK